MKEVKIFVLALIALFSISSCIKDESGMSLKDGQKTFVKSTLSVRQLRQTISELEIKIGKETRAGAMDVTEDDLKEILAPYVSDGEEIRSQIIDAYEQGSVEITAEDIAMIESMTEDQLASLSVVTAFTDEEILNGLEVSISDVGNCLGVATGIYFFSSLYLNGTKALMTVETAVKVAGIMIKRYVGYLGAATMIYTFVDCIRNINEVKSDTESAA